MITFDLLLDHKIPNDSVLQFVQAGLKMENANHLAWDNKSRFGIQNYASGFLHGGINQCVVDCHRF
jgi:hypothetical protein